MPRYCFKMYVEKVQDETFTGEVLKKWETWCNELIRSSEITTPRCVYQHPIENVLNVPCMGLVMQARRHTVP